tara:strand:+ start:7741 stop:8091 length:351 start_codon:yes stop_codon:yes gene_type:complete
MSFNYSPILANAGKLIQKFGQEYTFTRITHGTFNPATGKTAETTTEFTKYGILSNYANVEIGNATIEQGDRKLMAEAYDYEIGDIVSLKSKSYRVINISNIEPAATNLVAILQVRK